MVATLPENNTQIDEDFFADILAAINGTEIREAKINPLTLQQRINSFVERGISFAAGAENFEIAAGAENLTKTDTDFLVTNAKEILCHLQQMLLCKEIFDHEPALLDDFKTEVADKESVLTDGADNISIEVHESVVIETTRNWFAHAYGGNQ